MVGNPCHWCSAPLRAEVKGASVALWHPSRDSVIQRSSVLIHSFTATKRPAKRVAKKKPWHKQQSRNLNTQMSGRKPTGLLVHLSFVSERKNYRFPLSQWQTLIDCPRPARSQGSNHWHLSWSLPLFSLTCAMQVSMRNAKRIERNFLWDV